MKFTDSVKVGDVKTTTEGYLVATSRVGRTGVQEYLASELGMMGDDVIRVNRPESAVFAKDALSSLSRAPITINHPDEFVDAENHAELAVGELGDNIMRDGEWIVVNPMIKDKRGIDVATSTHKEFSLGYTASLNKVDHPDYEYEMTDFKFNHLALVPAGRAGHEARIGDSAHKWGAAPLTVKDKEPDMDLIKVMVGDKAVQVAAADADFITKLVADHDKAMAKKDTELADAKAKILTDEQIAELVDAKAEFKAKLKAVTDARGEEFVKDKSEAYIEAAYDLLDADVDDSARKALGDRKQAPADPWAGKYKEKKGSK